MNEITLQVQGMTCNHCKENVENTLKALPNVVSIDVSLELASVTVKGTASFDDLKGAIEDIGFELLV